MIKKIFLFLLILMFPFMLAYADLTLTEGEGIDIVKSGVGGTVTVSLDTTELGDLTFGAGVPETMAWTFSLSGATDPVATWSNNLLTLSNGLTLTTGKNFIIGTTQWNSGNSIDGTKLASMTSAQLATILSDESGTDKVAFTTSPVFTTPNIGAATGSVSGNAGSATILATARAINGVDFNGSAPITVPVNNANDTTNATMYPLWTATQGGNYAAKTTVGLTYNPSTGMFTAAGFTGALTGTASGNLTSASIDTSAELLAIIGDETGSASGTPLAVFNQNPTINGLIGTGVYDLGGATSTEIVNGANPTCDASGEIAINTTDKTLEYYNGSNQVAEPSLKIAQGTFDLAAQYDVDSDLWLVDLHTDSHPHGIYITKIYVDCSVADPTTELNANLMYCDAVADGAFPGANATLIKAIDTTTGNFADAAVNTAVATGKTIYIDIDVDPADATTQYHIKIHYYIPTS